MKKLTLLSLSFIFISCVSVKFPESLSVELNLDKESAKNLTQAINNSIYKTKMDMHHKKKGMSMMSHDNAIFVTGTPTPPISIDSIEFIGNRSSRNISRIMIHKGEKGENSFKFLDELPEEILNKLHKDLPDGVQIKNIMIDTVWTSNGSEKKVKIEVKIDNN